MKLPRRQFVHLAAGAAALPVVLRMAHAQAYPTSNEAVCLDEDGNGIGGRSRSNRSPQGVCGFRRNPAGYSDLMPAGIPI
jgi:hypothetical protein